MRPRGEGADCTRHILPKMLGACCLDCFTVDTCTVLVNTTVHCPCEHVCCQNVFTRTVIVTTSWLPIQVAPTYTFLTFKSHTHSLIPSPSPAPPGAPASGPRPAPDAALGGRRLDAAATRHVAGRHAPGGRQGLPDGLRGGRHPAAQPARGGLPQSSKGNRKQSAGESEVRGKQETKRLNTYHLIHTGWVHG